MEPSPVLSGSGSPNLNGRGDAGWGGVLNNSSSSHNDNFFLHLKTDGDRLDYQAYLLQQEDLISTAAQTVVFAGSIALGGTAGGIVKLGASALGRVAATETGQGVIQGFLINGTLGAGNSALVGVLNGEDPGTIGTRATIGFLTGGVPGGVGNLPGLTTVGYRMLIGATANGIGVTASDRILNNTFNFGNVVTASILGATFSGGRAYIQGVSRTDQFMQSFQGRALFTAAVNEGIALPVTMSINALRSGGN